MSEFPSDIAFTPTVKAIQTEKGSRASYARMEQRGGWETTVTRELRDFLSQLDMFYLGTSNLEGQSYIQYRGGPPGFLKVVDDSTLGFADFGGNRQYISLGNLSDNPRAFIFLMDYANSRRIKLWGRAKAIEADSQLEQQFENETYSAKIERVILFEIEAWDVNCPQHIHKRLPLREVAPVIDQLRQKITQLENEIASLRSDP